LWNNATAGVTFDDDHGVSLTLVMNGSSMISSELSSITSSGLNNNTFTQGSNFLSSTTNNNNITNTPIPFSFDLETIKFGRSQFPYNETIVLADIPPSLSITGGNILLNLPNNDTNLVAAQISNASNGINNSTGGAGGGGDIEHAVIVPLIKVFEPRTGIESLYRADLNSSPLNGTNPFTGTPDLVTDVTDLLLWNNATAGVTFDDDHGFTMTLLLSRLLLPSLGSSPSTDNTIPTPTTITDPTTSSTETTTTEILQQGPCPDGFFINQTTNQCQQRPLSIPTPTTEILQQGPCPDGFFINQTTNQCQQRPV
jgi:hypothetical protein